MKALVLQVRIGKTDLNSFANESYRKFEEQICIPSIQNWAKKCGYDYKMITESSIAKSPFFKSDPHRFACERLLHLDNQNYDYIIYIDADVYASKHAPIFPVTEGLFICNEHDGDGMWSLNKIDPNSEYSDEFSSHLKTKCYNTGVFSVDPVTGSSIKNYFLTRIENLDNRDMLYADQDIVNAWIIKNNCIELDTKWNYLTMYKQMASRSETSAGFSEHYIKDSEYIDMKSTHFVHFLGLAKTCHTKILKKFKF